MDQTFSVPLIAPAKIAGKTEPAGKVVSVSGAIAAQLIAAGAIDAIETRIPMSGNEAPLGVNNSADIEAALKRAEFAEARVAELEDQLREAEISRNEFRELNDELVEVNASLVARLDEPKAAAQFDEPASLAEADAVPTETTEQAGENKVAKPPIGKKAASKAAKG